MLPKFNCGENESLTKGKATRRGHIYRYSMMSACTKFQLLKQNVLDHTYIYIRVVYAVVWCICADLWGKFVYASLLHSFMKCTYRVHGECMNLKFVFRGRDWGGPRRSREIDTILYWIMRTSVGSQLSVVLTAKIAFNSPVYAKTWWLNYNKKKTGIGREDLESFLDSTIYSRTLLNFYLIILGDLNPFNNISKILTVTK